MLEIFFITSLLQFESILLNRAKLHAIKSYLPKLESLVFRSSYLTLATCHILKHISKCYRWRRRPSVGGLSGPRISPSFGYRFIYIRRIIFFTRSKIVFRYTTCEKRIREKERQAKKFLPINMISYSIANISYSMVYSVINMIIDANSWVVWEIFRVQHLFMFYRKMKAFILI